MRKIILVEKPDNTWGIEVEGGEISYDDAALIVSKSCTALIMKKLLIANSDKTIKAVEKTVQQLGEEP
ncbi:MAG: hypothetical protein NVS9B9_08600 [Ktedonobacteraceae bacterium]